MSGARLVVATLLWSLTHSMRSTTLCPPHPPCSSPLYQLDPALRKRDWRWHAFRNRKLSLAGGQVG